MRQFSLVFVTTILLASQGCGPVSLGPNSGVGLNAVRSAQDCKDWFIKLDANGDGVLTEAEYHQGRAVIQVAFPALSTATDAQLSAHLKEMDANKDGKVTPDEFMTLCGGTASPDPRPTATTCDDCPQVVTLDKDKDGAVSFEEFFVGKGGNQSNKDQLAAAFSVWDINGDGRLTAAEICGPNTPPTAPPADDCREFTALDANGDGKISDEEYFTGKGGTQATKNQLMAEFKAHDTNGDGVLTADELCGPSPAPSASPKPGESPLPSTKPGDSPVPSVRPSETPRPSPTPSAKPTDDCGAKFSTFDTNGNGSVSDEEYFVGMNGTQQTKYQLSADFKTLDTNGDGVLSEAELCATPWPRTATVSIYNPMSPFGPQSVDIVAGGTVTFNNVNSGASWTIRSVNSPSFPDVTLATSPSSGTTVPLTSPGNYEYMIDGTNPFVAHGHIIVH